MAKQIPTIDIWDVSGSIDIKMVGGYTDTDIWNVNGLIDNPRPDVLDLAPCLETTSAGPL